MRQLFVILFTIVTTSCWAQNNCNKLRTGKYSLTSKETGTTMITRKDGKQIEENDRYNSVVQYDVVWVGECIYELRNAKSISGDKILEGNKSDVIRVEIIKQSKGSYTARTTSNFSDLVLEREIKILK